MLAAVDEIRALVVRGDVSSLAFILELPLRPTPMTACAGGYLRKPYVALAAIERLRAKLNLLIMEREDLEDTLG